MPAVPTIAIVSWKDPSQMWLINENEFDPTKHTRWEDRDVAPAVEAMKAEPEMRQRDRAGRGTAGWPSVAGTPKEKSSEEKKEGT